MMTIAKAIRIPRMSKADVTFCERFAFAVAIGAKAYMPYCTAYVCL